MMVTPAPFARLLGNARRLLGLASGLVALLLLPSLARASTATTTVLSGPSTTVTSGTAITLTAYVHASTGGPYGGQVAFCDASAAYCTDIHRIGAATLLAGYANFKFIPGPGTHSYKAIYLGNTSFATSTSAAFAVSVTPLPATTTSIAQSGSSGSYSEFAVVSASGITAPTGTISILDTSNANYVLGTATLAPSAPSLTFTSLQTSSSGTFPTSVATADFNGDGKPDLAIVNYVSNSVTVLFGNGDGSFTLHATLSGFSQPNAIAVGDFNNDGQLDLAVINSGTTAVWVLLGTGGGNFGSVHATSVSSNPYALAVADFNDDGIADLVVTSTGSNSVDVLTGDGSGTFSLTGLHATGNNPTSVAVADFNNDGKQDMVVTNLNDGTVTVLFGNGMGNIASTVTLGASGGSYSVVTADLNGDGNLDFIVANYSNSAIEVFLGSGTGTFTHSTAGTGTNPIALGVGDFNGDGIPDLAAVDANSAGAVSVLLGNGDGTFQGALSVAVGNDPRSVAVADFNGDGIGDLAVPNYLGANANVLLAQPMQAATVTVNVATPVGTGTHQVIASYPGDANFAASTSGSSGLMAFKVSGQAFTLTASPPSSASGQQVTLIATISPYTAQGHSTDGEAVTFSTFPGGTVIGTGSLASGVATLTLSTLPVGTSTIQALYHGDGNFYSDASNDLSYTVAASTSTSLAITSGGTAVSSVAAGNAITLTATVLSGSASVRPGLVAFCDAAAARCTDVHRLGTAQLTSAGTATLRITPSIGSHSYKAVFLGTAVTATSSSPAAVLTATGLFPTATTLSSSGSPGNYTLNASVVSLTRVPLSGTVSFIDTTNGNAALGSASISVSGSTFALGNAQSIATGTQPKAVATGDFNGDGKPDFIIANYGASTLTVELGNGDGTFTSAATVSGNLSNPDAIAVGDFNGDGKQDLAVANYSGGTVSIFLGNGDGTFSSGSSVNVLSPQAVAVGDFNNDGIADLAVASTYGNTVSVLLGNGNGTFTSGTGPTLTAGNYPAAIVAADFNNDGLDDIAVANVTDRTITIFFGSGMGQFSSSRTISNAGSSYALATADLDADGNADLIALDSGGDTVTVLRGDGTGVFTALASPVTATNPVVVAVGDLNGDGIPDLVTASNNALSTLDVFFGNGDGTFQAPVISYTGLLPQALALADFNADGFADPVTANYGGNNASVLLAQTQQTAIVSATGISPVGPGTSHAAQATYPGDTTHAAGASNLISLTPLPYAATPTFAPAAGTYATTQTVTLSTGTAGATIFYTTDGTTPTSSSPTYTGPVPVTASETIKAISSAPNFQTSLVATAVYTIGSPPTITAQPASQTTNSGSTITLTVSATGTAPLTYQWFNGASPNTASPIAGATSSTYTTPNLTSTASFWVQVNNFSATPANSATATITVITPSSITTQPASQTITSGSTATLSVSATGTAPLTYQWFNGTSPDTSNPISGATSSTYTTPTLTATTPPIATFSYWVQVNNASATPRNSNTATITVNARPFAASPTFSPAAGTYTSAQTVTLSTTTPSQYGIYYTTDGSTPTAASPQYTGPISVIASETIRAFTAASGYQDSPISSAAYTINYPPTITTPPASQTINSGNAATLTVVVSGTAPLTYQWLSGPTSSSLSPIPGATAASYSTGVLTATTYFQVQVSNASGVPASAAATITVVTKPVITGITIQPASQTVNAGSSATLSVAVGGSSASLQWYAGVSGNTASPLTGATGSTYITQQLTATSSFWVRANNQAGSADSVTATITVILTPACSLSVQPTATALSVVATARCTDPQSQALSSTLDWGDGTAPVSVPASATSTHPYAKAGVYSVTVTATNISGLSGSATVRVSPNQSPVCTLGVVQGQISTLLTQYPVTVSGGCTDPQGQPLTLTLNWGDGTVVTPGTPPYAHTYSGANTVTYDVVLTATDNSGLTGSSAPQPVQIVPAQPIPAGGSTPVASTIPAPPVPPAVPIQVTFVCSSVSVQVDGKPVTTIPSAYGISCTSPSVTLTATSTPVNVTITTSNGLAAERREGRAISAPAMCAVALPFVGLALLLPVAPGRRHRLTALLLACLLCVAVSGCGGYFQAPVAAATPSGLYYVTLVETVVPPQVAPTGFVQTSLIVPLPVTH